MKIFNILLSIKGRINRAQFGCSLIGLIGIAIVFGAALAFSSIIETQDQLEEISSWLGLLSLWPLLAISVKRCHDRNKSGLWLLLSFIPVLGVIWFVVDLGFLEGTSGPNNYG